MRKQKKKDSKLRDKKFVVIFSLVVLLGSVIDSGIAYSQKTKTKKEVIPEERREVSEKGGMKEEIYPYAISIDKDLWRDSVPKTIEYIKNNMDKEFELKLLGFPGPLTTEEVLSIAPETIEVLLKVAREHHFAKHRHLAAKNLGELSHPSAIDGLKAALTEEKDIYVKVTIAHVLVACGEKETPFPILVDVVRKKDIDKWQVDTTGWVFGYRTSPGIEKERRQTAEEWKEALIPCAALRALARMETEEADSIIKEALNDKNPKIRKWASLLLGEDRKRLLHF